MIMFSFLTHRKEGEREGRKEGERMGRKEGEREGRKEGERVVGGRGGGDGGDGGDGAGTGVKLLRIMIVFHCKTRTKNILKLNKEVGIPL